MRDQHASNANIINIVFVYILDLTEHGKVVPAYSVVNRVEQQCVCFCSDGELDEEMLIH
jgi:hypothetical protein